MPGAPVLTRPDRVARQRTTLAHLAGLLHAMPPEADALRLLARLFDAVPGDDPVELEPFYGRLTRAVAELVEARRVAFLVRDDASWLRWQREAYGFPVEILTTGRLPCRPGGDALLEQVVFKDFLLVGAVSDDPDFAPYRDLLQVLDVSSAIVVPWRAGDERLGVLMALDPPRADGPTDLDAWVLRVAAGLAAIVWQRGREARLTKRDQQEAERLWDVAGRLASLEKPSPTS